MSKISDMMTVYAESDGCGTISLFAKNVPSPFCDENWNS